MKYLHTMVRIKDIKESLDKKKVLETVSDISNKKLEESIVKLGLSIRKEYQ